LADGNVAPKWGGHLWRLQPKNRHWEHLYSVPEGLVAVAGNGNWIYALGFWDHVLYQYNVQKVTWRRVRVGSVEGHVSRNIVVDRRGHVYVPRVRAWRPGEAAAHPPTEPLSAELVEFDVDLKEVGSTPLSYYADTESGARRARDSHGLVGLSYLADGSIVVTTHVGYLYRITPADRGAAKVQAFGWLHPDGASYASSLFPVDGNRYLTGVVTTQEAGPQWIVYDLLTRQSHVQAFTGFDTRDTLLYGSSTRDDIGRFYVVGMQKNDPHGYKPILLQVQMR
jgi:hypothetical protein